MHVDSHYESCQYSQYEIAEDGYISYLGSYIYLIQDRETGKYAMYVLDADVLDWPNYMEFIVENFKALGLDHALFCYPQYGFTNETYGF